MTNLFMAVGRITEIKENGVLLNIPRSFKNEDGIYENDTIFIRCYDRAMENIKQYCKIDDTMGARGRMESKDGNIELVADKITFLSTNKDLVEKESE